MRGPRFERSEDGQTWEVIDPTELRRKLHGYYRNVDEVITAMTSDGQTIRTPYALYRFTKTDPS